MSGLLDEWHELSDDELTIESWRPELRDVPQRPFDPRACAALYVAALPSKPSRSTIAHGTDLWIRDWCEREDFILDGLLTSEEARWWFLASTLDERLSDDRDDASSRASVESFEVSDELSGSQISSRLKSFVRAADEHFTRWPKSFLAPCARALSYLLPTDQILEILVSVFELSRLGPFLRYLPDDSDARSFVKSWLASVDLSHYEIRDLVQLVRFAPTDSSVDRVMAEAKENGKHEHLLELARAHSDSERFVETLLGFRRPRWTGDRIRECLARSEFARFDEVAHGVAKARPADQRAAMGVLARLHTPRIVEGMLQLSQKGVVRPRARKWLNDEGPNAVHRLIELAVSRKKIRTAAREILRGYVLDGRGELVLDVASRFEDSTAEKVSEIVREHSSSLQPELPRAMRSGWLTALADRDDQSLRRLADRLPELSTRDGYRLGRKITSGLLAVLSGVSLATHSNRADGIEDTFDSGLANAGELMDPSSAATFSRALFETWVRDQNPADQRWRLFAAAFLNGPATPEFLGDALSRYTRWMKLEDAPFALDTLRALGSPQAIYELERVRQRTRNGRIREHAELVLGAMADARRLTITAMLDQALADLSIVDVADPEDSGARDSRLRRRISDTLARRLEEAMSLGSTWQPMAWRRYFVESAGGAPVSRLILWQVVDSSGEVECLRVDESGELVGLAETVEVGDWHRIGVAHPASLSESELQEWNETFAQYEIVQPFLQLNRPVYRRSALWQGFRAPGGRQVDGIDLWNVLRRRGWEAIRLGSNRIGGFERSFKARKTIARLEVDKAFDVMSMRRGGLASRRTTLEGITFFDTGSRDQIDEVFVHPVVFSESHLDVQEALIRLEV